MATDPLTGVREDINEDHTLDTVAWPDRGRGCPVKVGQLIKLRTCTIEVTRRRRAREEGGRFYWRAWFRRLYPEGRVYLLARGAGDGHGYTADEELAERSREDPNAATTLASCDPLENPGNLGGPLEPEAVPPHEVGTFTGDTLARARYRHEVTQAHLNLQAQPLEVRLATVRLEARRNHVDISSEVRVIERRITTLERKVGRNAA